MKTLMKKIGGCKKARYWNMARFQPRRWHREHPDTAAVAATNKGTCEAAQPILDRGLLPKTESLPQEVMPTNVGHSARNGAQSASSARTPDPALPTSHSPAAPFPPVPPVSPSPSVSSVKSSEGTQPILTGAPSSESINPNSTLGISQKTRLAGIGCGMVAPSGSVVCDHTPHSELTNNTLTFPHI